MARMLAAVLMAFSFLLAGAVDSEAERPKDARRRAHELEHKKASTPSGKVDSEADRSKGARRRAHVNEHKKASLLDSEADRSKGAHRRAHELEHKKASPPSGKVDSEADRPKGARRRARERALAKAAEEEIAETGCVNLGGDKRFSDGHDEMIQVSQDRCWITFSLSDAQGPQGPRHLHRGLVRGYKVHVEPPFPDGEILPNQTIAFEDGKRWVSKL